MAIEIQILTKDSEKDYQQLLIETPEAMFNHSLLYRKFLQQSLISAQDYYLLAYDGGDVVAALPLFLKLGPLGGVVNSLPFYGSHGGVIAKPVAGELAISALMVAFNDFCHERNVICSTLIELPSDPNKDFYNGYLFDYCEERIGQITKLPKCGEGTKVEESLLSMIHLMPKRAILRAKKCGFIVGHNGDYLTFKALHALHDENIRSLGGIPKTWLVFEAIREVFKYDQDYRIYTATYDGNIVCALLIFYFKGMVEYFIPVTLQEYRSHQPLSLLIFTAMRDAVVERGATHWNWGGTWLSQKGVYQFKSRWGTTDHPYRYHIRAYRDSSFFQHLSKADLLNGYPYFYTIPFSALDLP
jgi:hypothetical protein